MRVHHRLGLQARIELPSCRLCGPLRGPLVELFRRDRLAYRRVVCAVCAEAPYSVVAVGGGTGAPGRLARAVTYA